MLNANLNSVAPAPLDHSQPTTTANINFQLRITERRTSTSWTPPPPHQPLNRDPPDADLTPKQKARLHEVADLMLQIYQTLARARYISASWIHPARTT